MRFFFSSYGHPLDLHVPTHSFPTRRSSDLTTTYEARVVVTAASEEAARKLAQNMAREGEVEDWDEHDGYSDDEYRVMQVEKIRRSEEHTSELKSLMRK